MKKKSAHKEQIMRVAQILIIIGSLNWLLIGVFHLNLVDVVFSNIIARLVYVIIGAAAVYIVAHTYKAVDISFPKKEGE